MTAENKLYFQAEKEAIFLILTGIGDEIYSTVDACNTAKEMWTAIERLQQGESLNVQDIWFKFVTVCQAEQAIDTVSYHKLFDVLKQFQNEVNDIRSERLARSANPLALLAAAQPYSDNYYQAPNPQRSNAPSYKQSSSTRSNATTRHKGKEIAKPVTPQSESVSEEDSDPEQARRDKDMQKNLALLANNDNHQAVWNQRTVTVAGQGKSRQSQKAVKDYRITKEEDDDANKLNKEVSPANSSFTNTPFGTGTKPYENDVFANVDEILSNLNPLTTQCIREKDEAIFCPDGEETVTLEKESRSKLDKDTVKPYNYTYQNSLLKLSNHHPKPILISWNALKKLGRQCGEKHKTILDSHCFIHELKREMNDDLEYVNSLEKELDELESEKADFSNIYDLLLEELIHSTSVSRPQLKSYQVKEKVVPNISQVKFTKKEVEDHHRISSISKKTKSVTACNDSSNSRTSNVNAVCAECGKCVFNSNHDACVSRYLKDVNARTKKPHEVPISASKPKRKANKSVATPHKKTVASDTTIQKSKSYYKKLYEDTNQEWKWWIAKRCPSDYTWTQKPLRTKKIWMPKIRKDDESTSISPTIDIVSRITNIVQLILFIVDSGCTKHMTGNLKLLCNFVEKFLGTFVLEMIRFAPILVIGDLNQGNVHDQRVYYVERPQSNSFLGCQSVMPDLKFSPTQAWLWHRRLSHLNFDYITLLLKKEVVTGLPKLKYVRNRTLVEAARTMLSASKLPLSFWAEAVATACYTQNRSIIISTHGKTAYHIINDRKPSIKHLHIFVEGISCLQQENIHIKFDEIKEMMSDHNSSDLAPQRQEMSVENVSSGLKTNSSQQGLEFLFSPLLEEYYNPAHGHAEDNNNDQAPNASFQEDEFINPFCTRVQETEQVRGNPTMPVQTRRQLATDPEMCMFALTVSIVEPKNIKEAMADSAWIEAMQDELHQFDRLKVWELVDKPFGKMIIKLKWLWKNNGNLNPIW
ncbi:retrovirus-related pol polyprotein from transposon TNT 1-94 [Tanacetum coccineum]